MSGLSAEDKAELLSAVIRVDSKAVGLDLTTVELIVARHTAAALTEAAEAIKSHYGGVTVKQVAGFRAGLDLAVSVVTAQTQRNLT